MDCKSLVLNERMKFFLELACHSERGTRRNLIIFESIMRFLTTFEMTNSIRKNFIETKATSMKLQGFNL